MRYTFVCLDAVGLGVPSGAFTSPFLTGCFLTEANISWLGNFTYDVSVDRLLQLFQLISYAFGYLFSKMS